MVFDDTPLLEFSRERELTSFREHFYQVGGVPYLTCLIQYQGAPLPEGAIVAAREVPRARSANHTPATADSSRGRKRPSTRELTADLSESERALFSHLREWRLDLAKAQGVPPYVILTNKQLVAILRRRPGSLTDLGHVEGIGPGKLKQYGAATLQALGGEPDGRDTQPRGSGEAPLFGTEGPSVPPGHAENLQTGARLPPQPEAPPAP